jgi:hypothetical protein
MKATEGVAHPDPRKSTVKANDEAIRNRLTSRRPESGKSDKAEEAEDEDSRDNVYATYWG